MQHLDSAGHDCKAVVCSRTPADLVRRDGRAAAGGAECDARHKPLGLCSGVPARLPCSADCISATCTHHLELTVLAQEAEQLGRLQRTGRPQVCWGCGG